MNIKSENNKLRGILLDAMGKRPMTRDELLTYTAEKYCENGTEQTPAETEELAHTVRSLAGTVLGALFREGKVKRDQNGRYSPAGKETRSASVGRTAKNSGGKTEPDKSSESSKSGKNEKNEKDKTSEQNKKNEGSGKGTGSVSVGLPDRQTLESELLAILTEKPLRRGELMRRLDEVVGVGGDATAAEVLHRTAEELLKELKRKKRIGSAFGVFRPAADPANASKKTAAEKPGKTVKPAKPVRGGGEARGKQMRRLPATDDSDKLRRHFLVRLYARGGAYLEQYAMNLLIKYYQDSGKVIRGSQVTGGSADGGIDGILEITDWLGFRECIMIQTKCRGSIQVTEKEIREFYGVVCSRNGSRGIFITTSTFHDSAKKLLAAIDNCVGVDGEKLFLMACRCHYGIRAGARGDEIDPEII